MSRPKVRRKMAGDAGQVAGIEALPFGVLIFVVGALIITNLWAVVDVKIAVDASAREAVRTYVEAPDATIGRQRADAAAAQVIDGYGRRPQNLSLDIHHEGERPFARCVQVTVTAAYPVPALRLPWIGGLGHLFDVRSHHSERIDPFRTGLAGSGTC